MAQPRVAVVGGGIAGTLCSLVLKNRGIEPLLIDAGRRAVGGRMRGTGAQFLRAADPRLATVVGMLEREGLVARWDGKFGLLGASGGFLPADIVSQTTGFKSSNDQEGNQTKETPPASDGGDFCRFVDESKVPAYVGLPSMEDLCPRIAELANIVQVNDSKVIGATPSRSGGWKLEVEQKSGNPRPIDMTEKFDALVLATHDPSVGSVAIRSIADAEIIQGGYKNFEEAMKKSDEDASLIIGRLMEISGSLQSVRDNGKKPVYAVSLTFPKGFSADVPFDAVSVPGSPYVQFLSREESKPGQSADERGETWVVISTTAMADHVISLEGSDEDKLSKASFLVAQEVSKLLAQYIGGKEPEILQVSGKRWGAAFCSPGLGLKEDSIFLAPWRLAICGDFIRDQSVYATPLEAAALSGLEAGERTAALWTTQVEN